MLRIGAGGRLGAALVRAYRDEFDVVGFNHTQLDLGNGELLRSTLTPLKFDVLINSAAQTNVDRCETHREEAFLLNAEAPRVIAEICNKRGARMIHVSTDYVFDGEKREPYTEDDPANRNARENNVFSRTPYFFHQLSRDHMEIRSAGPDKIMWTQDDPVIK